MSFLRKFALCSKPQSGRGHSNKGRGAQEGGGADGDASEDGENRVECAVCQDTPTDPCTVPCGNKHVFCLECLRGLVLHNNYTSSFPCPLCRTRVKIPLRGLAVLKDHKGWGERLLARLAVVRPRCPRRSGRHSWTSSNSVGSGSSWPPPDRLLEIMLPYLEEGVGQEAGRNEEPLPLDSAWLNRLRLGRLYVDTLTLTRRRPRVDSLSGSVDEGGVDDDDGDGDGDDINITVSDDDDSTTIRLDTIDVQLQRQILEEIEREVARVRRFGQGEEERGMDTDEGGPSPPPAESFSGVLVVAVSDEDDDNEDSVSLGNVVVGMDRDIHVNTTSSAKREREVEGAGGVRTTREKDAPLPAGNREVDRRGAEGGKRSPALDQEGDTDSLDMNCVMQLIADMERFDRPEEGTAEEEDMSSGQATVCAARRMSESPDNAGKVSRLPTDDAGRNPSLPDDTDVSGRGAGLPGRGGSARLAGAHAAARRASERRSRSDVGTGPWMDEAWKHTAVTSPTSYCIPRPKLVSAQHLAESQTSVHEADIGKTGRITTL